MTYGLWLMAYGLWLMAIYNPLAKLIPFIYSLGCNFKKYKTVGAMSDKTPAIFF